MNAFIKNISLAYAREFLGTVSSQSNWKAVQLCQGFRYF